MERRAYENIIFAFHETIINQNHATRYDNYCYGYNSFFENHICEEGGVHLKNFFLAFTDELEKQLSKKLLKWANKKRTNFNTYNVI